MMIMMMMMMMMMMRLVIERWSVFVQPVNAVGGRPPLYGPAPLLPRGCRSAFRRRADGNVAAVSHGQHVLKPTAAVA